MNGKGLLAALAAGMVWCAGAAVMIDTAHDRVQTIEAAKFSAKPVQGERASGLVTYTFRQKGTDIPLVALWDASNHPTNENAVRRVSLDVRGAPLAEPVLVDLVTGAVYRLPGRMTIGSFGKDRIYEDVPFYDAPVVLTERKLALRSAR